MNEAIQTIILYLSDHLGWLWAIIIGFLTANFGLICTFLINILKTKGVRERLVALIAEETAKASAKLSAQEKENNAMMREELTTEVRLLKEEVKAYIKDVKEENKQEVEARTKGIQTLVDNIVKDLK